VTVISTAPQKQLPLCISVMMNLLVNWGSAKDRFSLVADDGGVTMNLRFRRLLMFRGGEIASCVK